MARVTIEDCLDRLDSRFSLVHLAVRRVLQFRNGSPLLIQAPKNKEIVLALREIAAGKVGLDNIRQLEEVKSLPESTSKAKEEATHREVEEIIEAASQHDAAVEYDASEIRTEPDQEII